MENASEIEENTKLEFVLQKPNSNLKIQKFTVLTLIGNQTSHRHRLSQEIHFALPSIDGKY